MGYSVHIHEDDAGICNLYPASAFAEAAKDMGLAADSAEQNRAPEGGWTDVHLIETPKVDFKSVGLTKTAAEAAFSIHLPQITRFEIGFGQGNPFHHLDLTPSAFGFGAGLFVKLDCAGDWVKHIWFNASDPATERLPLLEQAFLALDVICPAMIADYRENCVGLIADDAFRAAYFQYLAE